MAQNAVFYWDESEDSFKAGLTSDSAGTSPLTATTLARLQVGEPVSGTDAATKDYVDLTISTAGTMSSFDISGDIGADTIVDAETINLTGGDNINTIVDSGSNTVTINLDQNLNNINSISNGSTNGDLILTANGTGSLVVNNILTFNSDASTPSATAITKLYSKTPGYGDTGVYFVNSAVKSGAEQELISKRKATVLAIALG
jgi:hypothetical protein